MNPYLLHGLMLLCSFACIWGSVHLVRARRKERREREQAVMAGTSASLPLFTQDPVTGTFVAIGQAAIPVQVHQADPVGGVRAWILSRAKALYLFGGLVLAFASPLLFIEPAQAGMSQTMRGIFDGQLKEFVDGIMLDTNGSVYGFAWMIFLAWSVLLFIVEVWKFMQYGFRVSGESNAVSIIWWFATFLLLTNFNSATSGLWNVFVGISNAYQENLVGNTDNFFLAQWIHKATAAVVVDDIDIFDTMKMVIYYCVWMFIGFLLDIIASLAAMWADFGYALAKVVGMVMVPFMLLPATRKMFDAWFQFFMGFGFLLVVIKATMVVAAISVKSIMVSLGVSFSADWGEPSEVVQMGVDNLYMLQDASAMLFIAVLFVLSSFSFASILAGGVGNLSGGLGTAAGMLARKFMK
ncbi:hypothetical protein QEM33_004612 [Pseudomonas putida]|nr:hypothetical protein [Pseudomonas putida]